MQYDSHNKFATTTVFLHWLVGLTIIGLLATGIYMSENGVYALYPWHKAIGFLVLFVALARVVWRMKNGWPSAAANYKPIEHKLASVVHWVLITAPHRRSSKAFRRPFRKSKLLSMARST